MTNAVVRRSDLFMFVAVNTVKETKFLHVMKVDFNLDGLSSSPIKSFSGVECDENGNFDFFRNQYTVQLIFRDQFKRPWLTPSFGTQPKDLSDYAIVSFKSFKNKGESIRPFIHTFMKVTVLTDLVLDYYETDGDPALLQPPTSWETEQLSSAFSEIHDEIASASPSITMESVNEESDACLSSDSE